MKLKPIQIKSKKGSIMDLLVWIIVAFVIVVFFGMWVYGFDQITTTLLDVGADVDTATLNITDATQKTFGNVNYHQTNALHILAFVMIFSMALSILITNFLVKAHPVFLLVYVMVIIAGVMASVYLSNQYEDLMTNAIIGSTLSEFTGASFIMLHLPVWVTIIGVFGFIFLFSGIMRDEGGGGGIV